MHFEPLKSSNLINYSLFILTICNLKCNYCYARKIKKWNQILPLNEIKSILKHLKNSPNFSITLLGGEPTLHKDLNSILNLLIEMDNCEVIELYTNGMIYRELPKSNKIKLFMSFHGMKMNLFVNYYYRYRYKNDFDVCICVPDVHSEIMPFIINNKIEHHIQMIVGDSVKSNFNSNLDTDLFKLNDEIVTLDAVKDISFKGMFCKMRYFLLQKDGFMDECNHKIYPYSYINDLDKILWRTCSYDSCFKNGDFLLYNKKVSTN